MIIEVDKMCGEKTDGVSEAEIEAAEEQREMLEKYMNADKVIVSKHKWLVEKIYEQHRKHSGSGEEIDEKEYVGKSAIYGGLEIYVDGEDKLWAGDIEWVIPIKIDFED